jgi:hypothetical protein
MSWRIETANPFVLLSELPDGWAQTCVLRPPRDLPRPCLIAILDRVRRVLRDDGTLWLSLPGRGSQPQALQLVEDAGWLRQDRALHRSRLSLIIGHSTVALFTKQQEFHFNARLPVRAPVARQGEEACASQKHSRAIAARRLQRRAWCVPAAGEAQSPQEVIDWCVRASTSPRACGVCGTPWRRLPGGPDHPARWRPACSHTNDRGRCLVFDPFCRSFADVGLAAIRAGRSYLGSTHDCDTAVRARARLELIEKEARR